MWGQVPLPSDPGLFPEAERISWSFGGLRFGDRNERGRIDPVAAIERFDPGPPCTASAHP